MMFGRSTVKHKTRSRRADLLPTFFGIKRSGVVPFPFRLRGTLFGYHCAFTLPLTCLHRRYFSEFYKSVAVCGDYTQRAVAFY